MNKNKIYPYLILIACCGLITVTFGFINTQGLYFDGIVNDLNVGRGTLSLFVTINFIVSSIVASTVAIKIRSKVNLKLLLIVCGSIMMGFYLLVPKFNNVYLFYLYGIFFGATTALYGNTLVVELLNSYFEKPGTPSGIALAFSGVFGMIYSPIAVDLISKYGWRNAYYSYAVIFGVVLIYSVLVVKRKPNEKLEIKEKHKSKLNKEIILLSIFYIAGGSITAIGNYLLPYASSVGLDLTQGAFLASVCSFGNLILKIVYGFIIDKFGGFKAALVCGLLSIVSLIGLLVLNKDMYILIIIFAFLLGSSYAVQNVVSQGMCGALFGKDNVASAFATLNIFSLVSSFSTTMVGATYDVTNSYSLAMIILLVMMIIGLLLVIYDFKSHKKSVKI